VGYKASFVRGATLLKRAFLLGAVLAVAGPGAALAADGGVSAQDPGLDLGVEQRTSRAPSGAWAYSATGGASLPLVDLSTNFRLGLRLSDLGQLEQLSARWGLGSADLTEAQALFWKGRLDRGPNSEVAISFAGGVRLDALADRLGLPRTPWVEFGLQTRALGADASGRTRMSSTLVLALDFDVLGAGDAGRPQRPGSGFRIRASAALGNDPGCNFGTPSLLFSGRCLSLALALEF
jgi:hypothetical protein